MDEQIRQRVVGAAVLMLLAIIVLPWLFGSPQDPTATIQSSFEGEAMEIQPDRDSAAPTVLRDAHVEPREQVTAAEPSSAPRPAIKPAREPAAPAPEPQAKSPPKPAPAAAAASREPPDRWLLQLASFSNPDNAERLRARLVAGDHKAYVEPVDVDGRRLYRVRVGPVAGKSQAQKLKSRLETQYKVSIRLYRDS